METPVELAKQGRVKEAYDRLLTARSLNLQHMTIWQIKVAWARDILTALTEMVNRFPGRSTIQNIEGGNGPHIIVNGYDDADMEWEMRVMLSWRNTTLEGEVLYDHPMRGRMEKDLKFGETDDGMDVASSLLKVMKDFVGTR